MKAMLKEWLKRYALAECLGTFTAYLSFFFFSYYTQNTVILAFAASLGENIGYYFCIILKEFYYVNQLLHDQSKAKQWLYIIGHIITEFGPAEIIDSLAVRPFCMGLGIYLFGGILGIITGKLLADVIFYIPVISSYELRKRFYKNRNSDLFPE